jgi:23S rRNA (pseudouridine1915-N3)-methyltransferase
MKIQIAAIGQLRQGAEKELVDDYVTRATKSGKNLKIAPVEVLEFATSDALHKYAEKSEYCIAMDEAGENMTSVELAQFLEKVRDQSIREITFFIGAADGLSDYIKSKAQKKISFGKMVWPHMLARVMLSEQIYRSISILNNTPYHRE